MLLFSFSVGFAIIVLIVIFRLQSMIVSFKAQIEKLSDVVNEQQEETRAFLNAYMNESRMMAFYREALDQCEDKEVVDLFQRLIKDEEKHIGILEESLTKQR